MDYVFSIAFAGFFALIYSVFTSFIASRSGRPIYRKIMWGYLAVMFVAASVIFFDQLPPEWLIFGAILTSPIGVVVEFGIALMLRHLTLANGHSTDAWSSPSLLRDARTDYFTGWFWRDNQNRINHRDWY
ncbi:hypothetical protein [Burkholderia gladioli]|uniref:hypothetical protein n=1 Tax=Burkholderia gladioli TaxID=28095 RepID=UPI0016407BC7|nr:hypothetical protein [Burkholderia gladioli]